MIDLVHMEEGSRMVRPFAFGMNSGRLFGRTDVWWVGLRFTGGWAWLYLLFWLSLLYALLVL